MLMKSDLLSDMCKRMRFWCLRSPGRFSTAQARELFFADTLVQTKTQYTKHSTHCTVILLFYFKLAYNYENALSDHGLSSLLRVERHR